MNNAFEGKKVCVTGGAGFLGSHLVDALIDSKAEVTVIDNLERGSAENLEHSIDKINFLQRDLKYHSLYESLHWYPPKFDYVFDLAAKVYGIRGLYSKPATMLSDNLRITQNTLKQVRCEKYIYVSSSCVYDSDTAKVPHKEDDIGLINSFYGWSKYMGEKLCEAYHQETELNYTIVRPFNVYGPRDSLRYPHVIPDFIQKAKRIKKHSGLFEILGDGQQTRSFTYIKDAVEGLLLAAEKGGCKAYNIGCETETSINDLAFKICSLMEIWALSTPREGLGLVYLPPIEGDVRRRCANSERARQELGWEAKTPLEEGLKETIKWFESRL